MPLLKKSLIYYLNSSKYMFVRKKDRSGCGYCKMRFNCRCEKVLKHPIITGSKRHVYLSINALCREINGRVYKRYYLI